MPNVRFSAQVQLQLALGAGDRDVEQAPLLGDGGRGLGVADGDEPVLEAGQVHDRPLEALGRVEGGDVDGVAAAGRAGRTWRCR